jgi:hypothetical protein
MGNALKNLVSGIFDRQPAQTQGINTTVAPTPGMLGTGLASNAATGMLMAEYRNHIAEAEANGQPYPTFEEWMMQRR